MYCFILHDTKIVNNIYLQNIVYYCIFLYICTNKTKDMITETLKLIKEQIGLDLVLCDYFRGIRYSNNHPYFNVELPVRISESGDYVKLERFAQQYRLIKVEPNGLNRVAIFPSQHFLTEKTI